jgi:hypothetical protein
VGSGNISVVPTTAPIARAFERAIDRYPFNSPFIRRVVATWGLPFWFALESVLGVLKVLSDTEHYLFTDARLYLEATRVWLAGGNPWDVGVAGNFFAAPPPSLLPLVPLAVLPPDVGVAALVVIGMVAAVATIRLLALPWWWLLFPPLVQAVLAGNTQTLLLPLILVGGGALAVLFKVYAAVPMAIAGYWRGLVVAGVLLVATAPILPWSAFVADLPVISQRLESQSTSTLPMALVLLLSPAILVAMLLAGRTAAAWLAVPALWPSHQFYYGTFALATRDKVAAALVALPAPGAALAALFVLAALAWRRGERPRLTVRVPALRPSA